MSIPGTISAALAYVPAWWQEAADPAALEALLVGWVQACGWRAGGFVWPAEGQQTGGLSVLGSTVTTDRGAPPEVPDAVRRVRLGEQTILYQTAGSSGRVYAPVMPVGRPMGLVWAEKHLGQPWADAERSYLVLTAKTMERSPAVALVVGQAVDPERLGQRLADAAVIAGRMAHDFDNILTGIIGFADLAGPLLPAGSQPAGFVGEIAKVGQRGITFTQQLHQLSRSGQVRPTPGSVAAVVTREEARLRPVMPAGLKVEKDLPPSLPAVALEAGPLQTALGHLLENAVEASPPGGTIRVSARPVELSEPEARAYLGRASAGPHLLVTVADAGTGIKPDVRRRLFAEPFFTTKVRHRGLGLAIVYRTLAAHRGGIQLDAAPAPGTGTQVRVVLPLAVRPSAALTTTPVPAHTPAPDGARRPGGSLNTTPVGG